MSNHRRDYNRKYYQKNKERFHGYNLEWTRRRRFHLKRKILAHYGDSCRCCGENIFEFLTIEHQNRDGAPHRKRTGIGIPMMKDIIENGFPTTIQILCMNCNFARGKYGECPHAKTA